MHRDAFEHLVHVDLHEACDERLAFKRHIAYGNGDDDLLVFNISVKYGYLRSGERLIVKAVIADIRLRAKGCIDKTVLVNESKLLEVVYLLHPRLVSLEVLHVRQIIIRHQFECDVQVLYLLVQIGRDYLFSSSGQLIEIQKAYRLDRLLRIFCRQETGLYRTDRQHECEDQASDDRYRYGAFIRSLLHTNNSLPCPNI